FDSTGHPLATSALGKTRLRIPDGARRRPDRPYIAPLKVDDDFLPTTTVAVRLTRSQQDASWIVGEIALEELWRMIDRIHVGNQGFALIVSEDDRLIAHGNPDERRNIAETDQTRAAAELKFALGARQGKTSGQYTDNGVLKLAVASPLKD